MEAFWVSLVTVGIAEIGDRSLFLALLLGLRYRQPWTIFWGMALGLFVNQALSAVFGIWFFDLLANDWHHWVVGIIFLIMAGWVLIPEDESVKENLSRRNLFIATAVSFFVLEMADKTQLVVITLAGSYQSFLPVVLGATLGILLVTTPAVWLGHRFAERLPIVGIKRVASALFLILGIWLLLNAAGVW
ncbi:MAG: TMEM165/GDT1 family protein [Idiomarina sp.]|nr:TMEM165/GDT1 family protein [Idiomarina sp.]